MKTIHPGKPAKSKNGAHRISVRIEMDAVSYDVVFEVRRSFVVPYTLWKRQK
ncbi:MAG TPA: hypothetical protein VGK14_14580 [Novimethylophilus sp.]|uniref:hypothetical protein n=1 Tax=Novimethylophilus sp. TaxID=2137426 RepID=UPI002F41D3AA